MIWANFLHIYQPVDQEREILEAVVNQSYRPILKALDQAKNVKITLNINASLTELLVKQGYLDVIDLLRKLGGEGKIEFTGSAKYHAVLPLLPDSEIERQIIINEETNRQLLGESYKPKGFFPPEMAYTPRLVNILEKFGYEWLLLDEIACGGKVGSVDYSKIYRIKDSELKVFFRERRVSNLIMSAMVRSGASLVQSLQGEIKANKYLLTAMDGETFGHHRVGLEKLLFDIFAYPDFKLVGVSDLLGLYPNEIEVEPVESTWASSEEDISKKVQFLTWNDPENPIHQHQHQLTNLVIAEVQKIDLTDIFYSNVRAKMDSSLASDQLFWASANPWWSIEMIESGAINLIRVLEGIPGLPQEVLEKAKGYYQKILMAAFESKRTGLIYEKHKARVRIPFKEATLETEGKEHVFPAFMSLMKRLEIEAVAKGEYEQAILWRDAVYKLENKNDIYDLINAVDLVRIKIPNEEVEEVIKKYEGQYKKMRGGQPEQRDL